MLREILAMFTLEVDSKELEKADSLTDQFTQKLLGVGKVVAGAFALDAVFGFAKGLINAADEAREAGIALGLPAQQLQALEFAASTAGVGVEELRGSLAKFNRTAAQSADGKGAAKSFKELGVELKNADGTLKTSGQLFEESGVALSKVQDPIKRAGLASDLFGRSYAKLLPLFAEGEEGIAALKKEAEELGIIFDQAFLDQSDEINDNLTKIKGGLTGIARDALALVLPLIAEFTQKAVENVKALVGWVRQTKLLQALLIGFLTKGVLALTRAIPALVARFGGWTRILATLGRFILRTLLPLLILEDIIVFLSGGKSAIGKGLDAAFGKGTADSIRTLIQEMVKFFGLFKTEPDKVRASFANLPKDLEKEFGAIGKFFGDLGKEMVEVGLFVVNALTGGWTNFGRKMAALWAGVKLAGDIVWTELKFAGLAVAAAIADAWGAAWNSIIDAAVAAINKIAGLVGKIPGMGDVAKGLRGAAGDLGSSRASTTAGQEIGALRDQERLRLAGEGDRIGADLTARATAPVPPGSNTTNNVNQTANVTVNVTGDVAPGTVQKIKGAARSGTAQGLDLRAAHAAGVQRGG